LNTDRSKADEKTSPVCFSRMRSSATDPFTGDSVSDRAPWAAALAAAKSANASFTDRYASHMALAASQYLVTAARQATNRTSVSEE